MLCCAVLYVSIVRQNIKKVCNGRGDCIRHKLTNDCCKIIQKIPTECRQITYTQNTRVKIRSHIEERNGRKNKNKNMKSACSATANAITDGNCLRLFATQYCLRRSVSIEWMYLFLILVCRKSQFRVTRQSHAI